ncbi:hypothetical protein [Methylobacterium sp. Leaf118]|uniref:hypothetical protein n=1 Tax=Methylobacterium sp. Leaf118 TaxID=2876562 RepID=UPI003FA5C64F
MKRFLGSEDRRQTTLRPDCLDDGITADNPARLVDVCVDDLDLGTRGFAGAVPSPARARTEHPRPAEGADRRPEAAPRAVPSAHRCAGHQPVAPECAAILGQRVGNQLP